MRDVKICWDASELNGTRLEVIARPNFGGAVLQMSATDGRVMEACLTLRETESLARFMAVMCRAEQDSSRRDYDD